MSKAATTKPSANPDLAELTVEQVQAGFDSGALTAESLVQACLDRIATYTPNTMPSFSSIPMRSTMPGPSTGAVPPARSSDPWPVCRSW